MTYDEITPYGFCSSCQWPMRKYNEAPDAYPFSTRTRSNDLQCLTCLRARRTPGVPAPPPGKNNSAEISGMKLWFTNYCADRARRNIPVEGIYFEGEEPRNYSKKVGI